MRNLLFMILLSACATPRTYESVGCPVHIDMLPNGAPDVEAIQFARTADARCRDLYGPTSCVQRIIRRPGEHNLWVMCGRLE